MFMFQNILYEKSKKIYNSMNLIHGLCHHLFGVAYVLIRLSAQGNVVANVLCAKRGYLLAYKYNVVKSLFAFCVAFKSE